MIEYTTPQKTCTKCHMLFPATTEFFHKSDSGKYKVVSCCKKCSSKINTDNQRKNPDASRKRRQRWIDSNPEKDKQSKTNYYLRNRNKVIEKASNRQKTDLDSTHRRNKKWKDSHPIQRRAQGHRRRLLENQGNNFSAKDVKTQYESQKGRCWWCQKEVGGKYHIDHRIPLSRGGSNAPDNIVISCPYCNTSKHNKLPYEWAGRLL